MSRRVYIETVGCQMNMLDSELLAARLGEIGYQVVDERRKADTILFNTCSVRQHAEDKIYSALGRLKNLKEQRPGTIIGVLGCMAQREGETILRRAPHVDLVVGPGRIVRLPELIEQVARGEGPLVERSLDRRGHAQAEVASTYAQLDAPRPTELRPGTHQAYVRAMFGCDQFCTYCIVPSVRGPEQSRPAGEIEREVRRLVDQGCIEVTLLGQAVNRYRDHSKGSELRLADLLARLDRITGLRRLRFITNHPKYMTDELITAVAELPSVCPYLHVPAQHGSDRILRRMNRGYSAAYYRELIERIRQAIPADESGLGAAVTSDFIVGFPGETDEEFAATVELVHWARFKNSFIFKYSPRPGTQAAERLPDDVPEPVKRQRNNALLDAQNAVSLADNQRLVGRCVEVFVEGPSKATQKQNQHDPAATPDRTTPDRTTLAVLEADRPMQLVGRTRRDRIVVFDAPRQLIGRLVPVTIDKADACTLFGTI